MKTYIALFISLLVFCSASFAQTETGSNEVVHSQEEGKEDIVRYGTFRGRVYFEDSKTYFEDNHYVVTLDKDMNFTLTENNKDDIEIQTNVLILQESKTPMFLLYEDTYTFRDKNEGLAIEKLVFEYWDTVTNIHTYDLNLRLTFEDGRTLLIKMKRDW